MTPTIRSSRERLEAWRMEVRLEDATAEIVHEIVDTQKVWARRYRSDVRALLDEIDRLTGRQLPARDPESATP